LNDIDGNTVELKQIEVNKCHKTLGAFKCLYGTKDEHIRNLKGKNSEFIRKTWNGQFNRRIARKAYNSNYMSSMLYTLVATNVYEKEINEIQQKSTSTFIRLQGYDISYPRAVIYGPKKMGGVGLLKLSVEGNCNKVEIIISHMNAKTKLGQEILINLNWLQIHSGRSCMVINSFKKVDYIQNNWFFPIKEFLNKINGKIIIPSAWIPKIHRANDIIIMDHIEDTEMTKPQQLIFNNWRLYLQITNLSDIVNLAGDKIRDEYLDTQQILSVAPSSKNRWPYQDAPDTETIKIWKKGIRMIANCSNDGILNDNLGDWIDNPVKLMHYPNLIKEDFQHILVRNNITKLWKVYERSFQLRSTIYYNRDFSYEIKEYDPEEYIAYDIPSNNIGYFINMRGIQKWNNVVDMEIVQNSFQQYIDKKKVNSNVIWDNIECEEDHILLENAEMIIACDGGAIENHSGSFGIVVSKNETIVAKIKARLPDIYGNFTSYRSECSGILGSLQLIKLMLTYTGIIDRVMNGKITIICDNKSAVDNINYMLRYKLTLKQYYGPDMDLVQEILVLMQEVRKCSITIVLEHIKGHQDRSSQENLSHKAILNIEADRLATAGLSMNETTYKILPNNEAMLFIDNKPVTSHHRQSMRDAYHSIQLKEYFWDKYRWSSRDVNDIWWSIHGKAVSCFTLDQQTTLNKYIHRRLPCNHRENMYYSYIEAICYNCNNNIETQDHIFQCTSGDERNNLKKKYLRELNILLVNNDTDDTVRRIINECVYAWLYNKEIPAIDDIIDHPSDEIRYAYNTQTYLGWNHFVRGRMSTRWRNIY
jgi:hypothetical protein